MISLVSDVIVALSAACVAVIALVGINRWRRELGGKAKFESARDIMLLSLKLEANFEWARYPLSTSWESTERKRRDNESPKEGELLDQWYLRRLRLQPLLENLQRIQELSWEAEALLDTESSKQVSEAVKMFKECWAELSTAIEDYFSIRHEEIVKGSAYGDQNWLRELSKEIYATSNDRMSNKVSQAKERLLGVLKAHVK